MAETSSPGGPELSPAVSSRARRVAVRICLLYLLAAAAWILFSGMLADWLVAERWRSAVELYKGWLFVAITAVLLYGLIRTNFSRADRAERRVRQVSALYAALSQTNQAIVHLGSREALFTEVCRIVVEHGGFRLAWIGACGEPGVDVFPQCCFGEAAAYLRGSVISWRADHPYGQGPGGEALRSGQHQIDNDLPGRFGCLGLAERCQQAEHYGLLAAGAFVVREGGAPAWLLVVYAGERNYFDVERLRLLDEMADDIGFALDRIRIEERLRLSARVFESSSEGIFITDAARRIVTVNAAYTTITGYTANEVLGHEQELPRAGVQDDAFIAALETELAAQGAWQGEIWLRQRDGTLFPAWLSLNAVRGADGQPSHFVAVFSDLSERKAAEAHIRHLAQHDLLTGLPNRALLEDRVQQALATAARHGVVGVLCVNLDRFKPINDALGHTAGDLLLRAVAVRLGEVLRGADTLARLSADEFGVLLPRLGEAAEAGLVGAKLLTALAQPLVIDGQELRCTASIGIAVHPLDGCDVASLLRHADLAMQHAKRAGRGSCQFFSADMNAPFAARLWLENQLSQALERGELHLAYQPQVELRSGRIVGAEALLRWTHPQRGAIAPADFIPLAEETGLILPIGEWVLREACRQAATWRAAGLPPLMMAVNLSARQLRSANLLERIDAALQASGLPPEQLELELTETSLMDDAEAARELLGALRARGIGVAIDDFGTGYSSLAYLKRFPLARLKIDRSFVCGLPDDGNDVAITRAIVALAHSLGLELIAEGVESAAQREWLLALGCGGGQGYLFARPLSAEAFAHRLAAD
ncbi:putative bifunctional diguanylate cyclase/phosphodiesterase [Plasticicumulans acidivorans]|uniref:cyclic-guanylate-specific phosphodiesterase n=1 Tax=Plasticicumulans acidivorans TaxID=886464 RepID=A0A317MS51_9GAMM|nr:EAL domain-containing protein [Plasticicumulans acidivorans]PWV59464.1 PAS domain S-box-containing protein/diguanylate cyclase (GGDEF)-like protein [Plasticicumulans acidivorans]